MSSDVSVMDLARTVSRGAFELPGVLRKRPFATVAGDAAEVQAVEAMKYFDIFA
jgi:hypothetical protein